MATNNGTTRFLGPSKQWAGGAAVALRNDLCHSSQTFFQISRRKEIQFSTGDDDIERKILKPTYLPVEK